MYCLFLLCKYCKKNLFCENNPFFNLFYIYIFCFLKVQLSKLETKANFTIKDLCIEKFQIGGVFECHAIDVYEDTHDFKLNDPLSIVKEDEDEETIENIFVEEDDNAILGAFHGSLQAHLESRSEYGCEDIRYAWNGVPVCNGTFPKSLLDEIKCPRCGSKRVFELQIFPTINNSLKLVDNDLIRKLDNEDNKLDFQWLLNLTTLLVFTCSSSCWQSGDKLVEECAVIQLDERFIVC